MSGYLVLILLHSSLYRELLMLLLSRHEPPSISLHWCKLCSREPWVGHARSAPVCQQWGSLVQKGHPDSSGWQSPTLGPMDWNARWAHGLWNQEIEKDQARIVKERWCLEFIQIYFIDPTTIQQLTLPSWPTLCQCVPEPQSSQSSQSCSNGLTAWGRAGWWAMQGFTPHLFNYYFSTYHVEKHLGSGQGNEEVKWAIKLQGMQSVMEFIK